MAGDYPVPMATKRIIGSPRGVFVEQPGNGWAAFFGILLGVLWLLLLLPALTGVPAWIVLAVIATGILGVPTFFLLRAGSRRRHRVTAILESRDVPGGTYLMVMDDHQRRHEVVADPAVAAGLANVLTGAA